MIFFCIPLPDDQNRWNRKNCPIFFHRVIFVFWIQICNPYLCKTIYFEIQLILRNDLFSHDDQNWWNQKYCPKFFHRVISALWIQICNPNLCKSDIFLYFELQLILRNDLFLHTRTWWPKSMKSKILPDILS